MKARSMFALLLGAAVIPVLSGCVPNLVQEQVLKSFPTLAESYPGLRPIGSNDARVILYLPDQTILVSMSLGIAIDGDQGAMHSSVAYKTAEIVDIPAGEYSLSTADFSGGEKVRIQARPGELYVYDISTLKRWINKVLPPVKNPQTQLAAISAGDIHCAHKQCAVKTITPTTGVVLRRYSTTATQEQLTLKARQFDIGSDVSRIYILRDVYTLGMVSVGLDAKPETKIDGDSFVVYEVRPGDYTITGAIGGGPHNIEQAYRVSTKGGECYFFLNDRFEFLAAGKGRELVGGYALMKGGFFRGE